MTSTTPRPDSHQLPLLIITRDRTGTHVHLNPEALPAKETSK